MNAATSTVFYVPSSSCDEIVKHAAVPPRVGRALCSQPISHSRFCLNVAGFREIRL
jgi:hypothetical protein